MLISIRDTLPRYQWCHAHDSYAMAAIILEDTSSNSRMISKVIAPGGPPDMSAYRAEFTGIFCAIWTINQICMTHDISVGNICLGCDGLSALQSAFGIDKPLSIDDPSYDIVAATHRTLELSPISQTAKHIPSHQDHHTEIKT